MKIVVDGTIKWDEVDGTFDGEVGCAGDFLCSTIIYHNNFDSGNNKIVVEFLFEHSMAPGPLFKENTLGVTCIYFL